MQVRMIAEWPEQFVRALPAWGDERVSQDDDMLSTASLQRRGLLGDDGAVTPFGRSVRYHLDEYRWQKGQKRFEGLISLGDVGPTVRALDVGCGAGQTLRLLEPDRPVELVGVDVDRAALALGARLAAVEGVNLLLTNVSATRLPFSDAAFDLVLTRVALNYMPQRRALTEMSRVLRPGGVLFCLVERIWYDLFIIRASRTPRSAAGRVFDLGWGTVHMLTGWQPAPVRRFLGSRAFASAYRLRRTLAEVGCDVKYCAERPTGPTLLGHRTQLLVIARKRAS